MKNVCVFCGSSDRVDATFLREAAALGELLAKEGHTLVYGSGAKGLMGAMARSALLAGGRVVGVIPRFMFEKRWHMEGLTELHVTSDMHERKHMMIRMADAFVALPGGCGTLEEWLEVVTWKQLGLVTQPVVIVNVGGYYAPLLRMFDQAVTECFMREEHRELWTVVGAAEEVLPAIGSTAARHVDCPKLGVM